MFFFFFYFIRLHILTLLIFVILINLTNHVLYIVIFFLLFKGQAIKYKLPVVKQVSLRFFPRGNLRLLLTSPMGTTSTLLFERPRDVLSSNFDDWPFLSVHFWGEKADGRWTLQIINAGNRHVNSPGK